MTSAPEPRLDCADRLPAVRRKDMCDCGHGREFHYLGGLLWICGYPLCTRCTGFKKRGRAK